MDATLEQARQLGAPRAEALCLSFRGVLRALADDLEAGESDLRRAVQLYRDLDAGSGTSISLRRLAHVLDLRGKLDEARAALEEAIPFAEHSSMRAHAMTGVFNELALNRMLAGDLDGASEALLEAEQFVRQHGACQSCRAKLWPTAVRVRLALGRGEQAAAHARLLLEHAERADTHPWRGIAHREAARVAQHEGQLQDARDAWSTARDHFLACGWVADARGCESAVQALSGPR